MSKIRELQKRHPHRNQFNITPTASSKKKEIREEKTKLKLGHHNENPNQPATGPYYIDDGGSGALTGNKEKG